MADDQPKEAPQNPEPPPGQGEQPQRRRRNRRRRGPRNPTTSPANNDSLTPDVKDGAVTVPRQERPGRPNQIEISIVIPLLNEEKSLRELHQQIRDALNKTGRRYEIIFVDDGSTDESYKVLRDLKRSDHHRIRIVRFRRNYGKSAALSVGFEKASGEYVVTMDSDLQDDPSEIAGMIRKMSEGYDLISGWKKVRHDPLTKRLPSRFFNFVTRLLTGIKIHDFNCGLKVYRRDVVKTVRIYGELHRYLPVLAHWEGFTIGEVVVRHRARRYGKTKFGITRFWRGFLDLLTVLFTTRYIRKPLHLFGFWGMAAAITGAIIVGYLVVQWFLGLTSLSNRPLFLGGVMLIIVGIQFVSIGLLGEMISKSKESDTLYSVREFIP